jgi:toxin ParE1/3/4
VTAKPVVPSISANWDVRDAVDYYTDEGGEAVANRFLEELESTYVLIQASPGAGSPRYEHELGIENVRNRRLRRYPYLVFYAERPDRIDILRVLHARRDIPAYLGES